MRSKNKPAPNLAERKHILRIKEMPCIVCDKAGPSDAHELTQGAWWTCLPLCKVCHMHPVYGFHGARRSWKLRKLDELGALNLLIPKLLGELQ